MMKIFLPISIFCLVSIVVTAQTPAQTIPSFVFFKADKTPFTQQDLQQGKQLFFEFFDTGCEHCQRATAYIADHYDAFRNVAMYMVTLDSPEKVALFFNKYGAKLKGRKNITLLQDTQYQFIPRFQPRKYPSMFLYSKAKKLLVYTDDDQSAFRIVNAINASVK